MSEDKCVMCDAIIPEGRQVCPTCERAVGCHGRCERHGRWLEYRKRITAERAKDREMGAYMRERSNRLNKVHKHKIRFNRGSK